MTRYVIFALLFFVSSLTFGQPVGGELISLSSRNADATTSVLQGVLFKPQGIPRGGVVLIHGSSGWTDHREGHYGRAFSAAGYMVLAVDSFGARGVSSTAEDQSRLSTTQMTMDAFSARRYMLGLGIISERIAVMGFSKGGMVALFAADRTYLPDQKERFAVAIPFYPGCITRPREPKPASSMYMALGAEDDYTGVKPCQDIATDFARAGGQVQVKVYPDSTHGFDGNPANLRAYRISTVENYIDCVAEVDSEGKIIYAGKKFAQDDSSIVGEMKKSCMKKGATIWTNVTQKKKATEDVISYLNRVFAQ